jgi:uncharacterized protein
MGILTWEKVNTCQSARLSFPPLLEKKPDSWLLGYLKGFIRYAKALGSEYGRTSESIPLQKARSLPRKPTSKTPDYHAAVAYALGRLKVELSPDLTYHNLRHTREDVLAGVTRLAISLGLPDEQRHLVEVAAAFHDLGFIYQYTGHEQVSAELAAQVLPGCGFTVDQIRAVLGMIMATRLPQSPHDLLEQIVADADMDVLGREDFWLRNQGLRAEVATYGHPMSDNAWYNQQLQFLKSHRYFTLPAEQLRGAGKRQNIAKIEAYLLEIGESIERDST